MAKFIKVHIVKGWDIALNAECIISIKDMRHDPTCKDLREWHFTIIRMTDGSPYQVLETEEQILAAINS